jgi:glutaminyl-peptide cyclotransferase
MIVFQIGLKPSMIVHQHTEHNTTKTNPFRLGKLCLMLILLPAILGCTLTEQALPSIPETLSPLMTYAVVNAFPHDPGAFTQGLLYHDGYLYESTGLYGASSLRKVELETGFVLQQITLPDIYFGEGLTLWEDTLLQLTWQEQPGFVYALEDLTLLGQFSYPTEGWGLTHDGARLILSDGSHWLYFLDPDTFEILDQVEVTYQGQPVARLNELETIYGEIFANIWLTDDLVRIDPATGEVIGWIDLSGILPDEYRTEATDVLNGIAYDPEGKRLFVTGKRWPLLFEIRLVPQNNAP